MMKSDVAIRTSLLLTYNKPECQTLPEPLSFLSQAQRAALPCARTVVAKVSQSIEEEAGAPRSEVSFLREQSHESQFC